MDKRMEERRNEVTFDLDLGGKALSPVEGIRQATAEQGKGQRRSPWNRAVLSAPHPLQSPWIDLYVRGWGVEGDNAASAGQQLGGGERH